MVFWLTSCARNIIPKEASVIALEGKLVILREEQPEDMARLTAMRNDLETQAWSKTFPPDYTESMYLKRFEKREFSFSPEEGRFIIESKEAHEFAGTISYTGLEPRWAATIGIMVAKNRRGVNQMVAAITIRTKPSFIAGKNRCAFSMRFILTHI